MPADFQGTPEDLAQVRANVLRGSGFAALGRRNVTKPGRENANRQSVWRRATSCLSAASAPGWQTVKTNRLDIDARRESLRRLGASMPEAALR